MFLCYNPAFISSLFALDLWSSVSITSLYSFYFVYGYWAMWSWCLMSSQDYFDFVWNEWVLWSSVPIKSLYRFDFVYGFLSSVMMCLNGFSTWFQFCLKAVSYVVFYPNQFSIWFWFCLRFFSSVIIGSSDFSIWSRLYSRLVNYVIMLQWLLVWLRFGLWFSILCSLTSIRFRLWRFLVILTLDFDFNPVIICPLHCLYVYASAHPCSFYQLLMTNLAYACALIPIQPCQQFLHLS